MIDQVCVTDVLLDAAKEVFQTMIFMDIEASSDPQAVVQGDTLLGSITFKGDIEGCLGICCDRPCGQTMAANMLGMESGQQIADQDLVDAIGEVTNMVMGSVKARLLESTPNIELSIPSVVSGRELKTSLGEGTVRTLVKVRIDDQFNAELFLLHKAKV